MLTKRQLSKAYEQGCLDTVAAEVRRYGNIVQDNEWTMEDPPRYAGAWRRLWINHHGRGWEVTMHNGEIVELGYKAAPVHVGIHGTAVTEEEDARDKRIRDHVA